MADSGNSDELKSGDVGLCEDVCRPITRTWVTCLVIFKSINLKWFAELKLFDNNFLWKKNRFGMGKGQDC
jgi:hypothetical protein